jgi:hypothetical protein
MSDEFKDITENLDILKTMSTTCGHTDSIVSKVIPPEFVDWIRSLKPTRVRVNYFFDDDGSNKNLLCEMEVETENEIDEGEAEKWSDLFDEMGLSLRAEVCGKNDTNLYFESE